VVRTCFNGAVIDLITETSPDRSLVSVATARFNGAVIDLITETHIDAHSQSGEDVLQWGRDRSDHGNFSAPQIQRLPQQLQWGRDRSDHGNTTDHPQEFGRLAASMGP